LHGRLQQSPNMFETILKSNVSNILGMQR